MSEKERTASTKDSNLLFYGAVTLVILLSFLLLVPKVASSLFPFKRQMIWNNFISQVQKNKKIDPQAYWEFREFYSPGYFTDNKSASSDEIANAFKKYGITDTKTFTTLLTFHSSKTESLDTLTTSRNFKQLVTTLQPKSVLFTNDSSLIFKLDDKHVVITFLKPLSEMKKANGFFDYAEKDKKLVNGKMWFNITELTLP